MNWKELGGGGIWLWHNQSTNLEFASFELEKE
jgi:hypothetical protein